MILKLSDYQKILCIGLSSAPYKARSERLKKLLSKVDINKLYSIAKIDEIDSHLGWLMGKADLPISDKWINSVVSTDKSISNLMDELERVAQYLFEYDIKIVALKNAGITKGIYPIPACSPMGDIDLLVSSSNFHEAHKLLINDLGYTFKFRSELDDEDLEEAFRGGGTEYYQKVNGYEVWLELQWRPVAGRWIQPHNEPDGNKLVEHSIEIPGSKVRILSPEDNLLQVCLHTAKHSYCRAPGFRLHSDVDRIVRHTEVDWSIFVKKVKDLKLNTAVYFSLFFAKELLDTSIPEKVLMQLRPSIIKQKLIFRFLKKAGLFDQEDKKFSKTGYIFFNILLYDSIFDLGKGILPAPSVLKEKYEFESNILFPYFYWKRILDLIFKRSNL